MTSDPKAETETKQDARGEGLRDQTAFHQSEGQTASPTAPSSSAEPLPEASEEEARASHQIRMLLSQARREALMALQRLEDVERRAATDERLQDDRLHLRLDAIGECRRRLIAVLPLSPGGGPAPLPPRAEENEKPRKTPGLFDTPDVLQGKIRRFRRGSQDGKGRGRAMPALPRRVALIACLGLLVIFAAYLLGTMQRPDAEQLGAEPASLPGASAPAGEPHHSSAVARNQG